MVRHAVKQMNDPLRIQLKGGHLLPEPLAAVPIRPRELGLRHLAGEPEHQLALFPVREALGCRHAFPGPAPSARASARGCGGGLRPPGADDLSRRCWHQLFQGSRSRDGRITFHFRQEPPVPPGFAMKRIARYNDTPFPDAGGDLPW